MNESKNKLLPLNGLRGLAAFIVVLHHLRLAFFDSTVGTIGNQLSFLPAPAAWLLQAGMEGLLNGLFAVWVFWVLSGFVLSLQFFQRNIESSREQARDYLKNAALRRYPRLMLPVLASVLLAWLLLAAGWMHNQAASHQLPPAAASSWLPSWYLFAPSFPGAVKSALWDTFFDYNIPLSYNNVLWTMSRELWGSLWLFVLLFICGHLRSRCIIYGLIAILLVPFHAAWYETFLGGIVICDLYANRQKVFSTAALKNSSIIKHLTESPAVGGALWLGLVILSGLSYEKRIVYSFLAISFVALAIASGPSRVFLGSPIPAFLGKISFGMYLVHVPIILSFSCWAYLKLAGPWSHYPAAIAVSLTTIVISIAAGWLFHRWIDEPSMKVSRWLAGKILRTPERARM